VFSSKLIVNRILTVIIVIIIIIIIVKEKIKISNFILINYYY